MSVAEVCKRYTGQQVRVLVCGGNAGDGLIYEGAKNLFVTHGVKFTEVQDNEVNRLCQVRTGTLFVYGCGGYCASYHSMTWRLTPAMMEKFETVVILPSTYECSVPVVSKWMLTLPGHVTLFCRELISFDSVKSLLKGRKNEVLLDHDTAFSCDWSAYKAKASHQSKEVLHAFRIDTESLKKHKVYADNKDVSEHTWHGQHWKLVDEVAKYKVVHTDRAHVAITAAMLGKELHMYPDNHHKLKGIYEYSLAHLPNVTWHETN